MIRFINGKLVRDGKLVEDDLWINLENGKIVDPMKLFYEAKTNSDLKTELEIVDCAGKIVAPGFIDLQCNGGFGYDFSDVEQMGNEKALHSFREQLVATGVTAFCPTLISLKPSEYKTLIPKYKATDSENDIVNGSLILGIHLEGPYFSKRKIGAHPLENIRVPEETPMEQVYGCDLSNVRIITLAPELPGATQVIKDFTKTKEFPHGPGNRIVSMGHTSSNLQDADVGVRSGATMITHLFNAMGAFHHRDPGLIGLLGRHEAHDKVFYGIIADGLHAHSTSVAMAFQSHPKGVVLVTDAMSAMGLPEGRHSLGAQVVDVVKASWKGHETAKKAVLANDSSVLAGSVVNMQECVSNFREFTGCSIPTAIEAATLHPAQAIGIDSFKGTLNFGSDGDVVLLDPETLEVSQTYIRGKCVFLKKK